MKRIQLIGSLLLLISGISAMAQQQGQYSMYMVNQYVLNPAVTGTEDYIDLKAGFRAQWVGLEDAPKSYYVTGHAPIGKHMGHTDHEDVKPLAWHSVGGMLTGENTGPLNKTNFYVSYAYHLPLSSKINVSLGAFLGGQQYRAKQSELTPLVNNDPTINQASSAISPDGSLGLWVYGKRFYVGTSTLQIFNNKVNVSSDGTSSSTRLNRHYFATAGYRIKLDSNWTLVPSIMIKGIAPAPASLDLNCKIRWQDKFWGGVSWRNMDAVVGIIGMTLQQKYDIGYSYDYTTSQLANYSSGSHEIVIGYRISHLSKKPAPAQFW